MKKKNLTDKQKKKLEDRAYRKVIKKINKGTMFSTVKSTIKTKKAKVANIDNPVNTTNKTVVVQFPFDTTQIILPYNLRMESYLTSETVQGKAVSVWYCQSINNGIVMQDCEWCI